MGSQTSDPPLMLPLICCDGAGVSRRATKAQRKNGIIPAGAPPQPAARAAPPEGPEGEPRLWEAARTLPHAANSQRPCLTKGATAAHKGTMSDFLSIPATGLAKLIRDGELTSSEVVDGYIRRIEEVNPRLNAVVATRYEEARQEAAEADRVRASCKPENLPPFHGVPCTIKEAFALTGMPQTGGLLARRGFVASEDATAVARLRAAGAIPLGVTNVSELCMWMESHNRVYGRTNNPYDKRRIAGGSSGGEGSIIGAGGSPMGLGADIGGSIRLPAFFNGVFGHKPTGGLVPGTGQFPNAENEAQRYLTTGPLVRYPQDLMPLLRVLAGPDGIDRECRDWDLGDPEKVKVKDLSVLDVAGNGFVAVSDDLKGIQGECAQALAERGLRVERARFPELKQSLPIWSAMLSQAEETSYRARLGEGRTVSASLELLKWSVGRSAHTLPSIGLAFLEQIQKLAPGSTRLVQLGARLRQTLIERIGPCGVMLYPSYASTAPRHLKPLFPPIKWVFTAIFNVMGFPVTQVPLGLNRRGLPLGVQVVSIPGNDHVTIAVAKALAEDFGGWVPPRPPH